MKYVRNKIDLSVETYMVRVVSKTFIEASRVHVDDSANDSIGFFCCC